MLNKSELYDLINSLSCDIEFEYKGKHGAICPFNREHIVVAYCEEEIRVHSIEQAMKVAVFDGLCLEDVCEDIEFDL